MHLHARSFHLPKAGNADDEYEDACLPEERREGDVRVFRAAIADGATETSFSRLWAQLLVAAFVRGRIGNRLTAASLRPLQDEWKAQVGTGPQSWYVEEKIRDGAFSSLLGLRIDARRTPPTWSAVAVGDSCLVHVSGDSQGLAFPLDHSAQFTNRPHLLSSDARRNAALRDHVARCTGTVRPGDAFLLMTDALAAWYLRAHELGNNPWRFLRDVQKQDEFDALVGELRSSGEMRNDDVTALFIDLPEE